MVLKVLYSVCLFSSACSVKSYEDAEGLDACTRVTTPIWNHGERTHTIMTHTRNANDEIMMNLRVRMC